MARKVFIKKNIKNHWSNMGMYLMTLSILAGIGGIIFSAFAFSKRIADNENWINDKVGQHIVINSDTLEIVDYSKTLEYFKLSDKTEVSFHYVHVLDDTNKIIKYDYQK